MNSIIIFILIVGAIIIGILFATILVLKFKKEDLPGEIVQVTNFMSQYSKGYSSGLLQKIERGSIRSIVYFFPQDIDYNKIIEVSPVKVVVNNDNIYTAVKGTLSSNISHIFLLPPYAEELPTELKRTDMGKNFMELIEKNNSKREENSILRKRIEAQGALLNSTEGYGLVEEFISQTKNLSNDFYKNWVKGKENKQSGPIIAPNNPQQHEY